MRHNFVIGLLLLAACGGPMYPSNYPNYTSYAVTVTGHTPDGVQLDDPKHELDPVRVDRALANVLECLRATLPLSAAENAEAQPYGQVDLAIHREFLVVKAAPDWYVSVCTGEQLFPCSVPLVSCTVKGLVPTEECPCACRAMIQDNRTLITAPNMKLLPANAVTLFTGYNYPWTTTLGRCSSPDLGL